MKNVSLYTIAITIALLSLIRALVIAINRKLKFGRAPVLLLFFAALAIGFRAMSILKALPAPIAIFAALTTALYYPQYFGEVGGFKLSKLTTSPLRVIMFGMGTI